MTWWQWCAVLGSLGLAWFAVACLLGLIVGGTVRLAEAKEGRRRER